MRTNTHRFLRLTQENYHNKVLYPNDRFPVAGLDYYLTEENDTEEAKKETVRVRAYSGSTKLFDKDFPISELFTGQYL